MFPVNLDPSRELIGYLVRHGELNIKGKWDGWGNFVLSPEGRESAEKAGQWLSFMGIGRIITSDLPRALQTADIISGCCETACPFIATDPNLRAWAIGDFTGKDKTDERKAEFQHYRDNPNEPIPNGESFNQMCERVKIIFQYLCSPYKALPTVIVCHNSVLKGLMGIDEKGNLIEPGGIIAVYIDDKSNFDFDIVMGATSDDVEASLDSSCA
jgi:broad specificity phosphatase PhoE